ncbi:MAG: DsbE family thiol:disulfide interchange protein [Hyphomicrobiaceae bacterium]
MSREHHAATSPAIKSDADKPRRSGWIVLPLAMFFGLAIMFAFALFTGDPSKLPSALIGRPAPKVDFAPLEGLKVAGQSVPGFTAADLSKGNVTIVNFWASWCVPCVQEHPMLIALAMRTGVPIYGVNYKDEADNARRFIGRYGNPYKAVGVDPLGRGAIEWGVYGMPETFVVDGKGRIAYKHVGPISLGSLEERVIPAIEKAREAESAAPTAAKP